VYGQTLTPMVNIDCVVDQHDSWSKIFVSLRVNSYYILGCDPKEFSRYDFFSKYGYWLL